MDKTSSNTSCLKVIASGHPSLQFTRSSSKSLAGRVKKVFTTWELTTICHYGMAINRVAFIFASNYLRKIIEPPSY